MLSRFKHHPFAVEAFFEYSMVLTYAVPKHELQGWVPACFTLDTFQDEWAFVAVAFVQTKALRPKGFPTFLGSDFFLIGYRVFIRYTSRSGKKLRGLYILKSETDSRKMTVLGSLLTQYRYTTTDIQQKKTGTIIAVTSQKSQLGITVETAAQNHSLPPGSPFNDWKEARRFAGPLPFTFSFNSTTREVLVVKGIREHWQPAPVEVLQADLTFFEAAGLKNTRLASAFLIRNIPYEWQKGYLELWQE